MDTGRYFFSRTIEEATVVDRDGGLVADKYATQADAVNSSLSPVFNFAPFVFE